LKDGIKRFVFNLFMFFVIFVFFVVKIEKITLHHFGYTQMNYCYDSGRQAQRGRCTKKNENIQRFGNCIIF
jgi:hypothetical protein